MTSASEATGRRVPDALSRLVGSRFARIEGADPVSAAGVRQLLEAMEWDRSLDDGPETAGWPVPLSTYLTFAMPPYRVEGERLRPRMLPPLPYQLLPLPGARTMGTSVAVASAAPLRHGDVLTSDWSVTGVRPAHTRVGDGVLVDVEARFFNRSAELVATERTTVLNFDPVESVAPDQEARGQGWPAAALEEPLFDPRSPSPGTRLEPVRLDMTLQRLVMLASANRDFAPIHHDPDAAAEIGASQPVVNTMFLLSFTEQLLAENGGAGSRAVRLGPLRLHRPTPAGSTLVAAGTVTAVEPTQQGWRAAVAVRIGPQDVGPTVTGTAELSVAGHQ